MINKYLVNPDLTDEVKYWITHNLANYLKKNPENQTEIEHIIDFLSSDMAPTRLRKMSYSQAKAGADKWNELLQKRGASIQETDADVKPFIKLKSGYRFVQLITKAAYDREGALMRHCVGNYYGKNDVKIYSLRDPLNNPHCTIEVVGDAKSINQIKGKGNGSIHPDYIGKVLLFLKKLNVGVRSSELRNLGYEDLEFVTPGFTEWLLKSTRGAKFKVIDGKKYFYVNSKLEVINET